VFPLAILLIYIILAAQFRSYLQPLLVMVAVPFGVMGVPLGLSVFGYTFSFPISYGMVGLSGVVVNDSLVLVTFINRARDQGVPLYEAVVDAGQKRLRPVLLTTSTTVSALLPTALGLFGRTRTFSTLAAAFASGLTLATLFTLFVVPAGYYSLGLWQEKRGGVHRRTSQAEAAMPRPSPVGT
jgi:HAE1 family hydrophobic/amphiphilic exporter-1